MAEREATQSQDAKRITTRSRGAERNHKQIQNHHMRSFCPGARCVICSELMAFWKYEISTIFTAINQRFKWESDAFEPTSKPGHWRAGGFRCNHSGTLSFNYRGRQKRQLMLRVPPPTSSHKHTLQEIKKRESVDKQWNLEEGVSAGLRPAERCCCSSCSWGRHGLAHTERLSVQTIMCSGQ